MTKQQFILKMLDILGEDRPLTKGLRILIENDVFSDRVLDGLMIIFQSGVNSAMAGNQLEKLKASVAILQKLKTSTTKENSLVDKDLADLDAALANL